MTPTEIEAKLVAPSAHELIALPRHLSDLGLIHTEPERVIARDHYLDTEDLHLWRAGWALRLRDLGIRKLLTMKALRPAGDDGLAVREEHETEVQWEGGDQPRFPQDVLGGRLDLVLQGRELRRIFHVHQERMQFHAGGAEGGPWDGFWVEASMDLIRWEGVEGTMDGFEAELELTSGPIESLRELMGRLAEATGWEAGHGSKFERGLRVAGLA